MQLPQSFARGVQESKSGEKALPILRTMEYAQDQNLVVAHAVDHQPAIKRKDDGNPAKLSKAIRGRFAGNTGSWKAAQKSRGVKDGGKESVGNGRTRVACEPVPSAFDLTKSYC
jgi:hypothetical protein